MKTGAPDSAAADAEVAERRGRKASITPQIADRILTLLSVGFSRRQAADYVGIDHTTITRTAVRDADFARSLQSAEARAPNQPTLARIAARRDSRRAASLRSRRKISQTQPQSAKERLQEAEEMLADERIRAERMKHWVGLKEGPLSKKDLDEHYARLVREAGPMPRRPSER